MWKGYDTMGQVYVGAFRLHAELWNTQGHQKPTIEDFKFSLATIQQHVYFRRTTCHLLAMLVNKAGSNVSVLCPLEQPVGGF
jgi:hypothetical protein